MTGRPRYLPIFLKVFLRKCLVESEVNEAEWYRRKNAEMYKESKCSRSRITMDI